MLFQRGLFLPPSRTIQGSKERKGEGMDELETICALYYEISGKIMVEGKLDSRGGENQGFKMERARPTDGNRMMRWPCASDPTLLLKMKMTMKKEERTGRGRTFFERTVVLFHIRALSFSPHLPLYHAEQAKGARAVGPSSSQIHRSGAFIPQGDGHGAALPLAAVWAQLVKDQVNSQLREAVRLVY